MPSFVKAIVALFVTITICSFLVSAYFLFFGLLPKPEEVSTFNHYAIELPKVFMSIQTGLIFLVATLLLTDDSNMDESDVLSLVFGTFFTTILFDALVLIVISVLGLWSAVIYDFVMFFLTIFCIYWGAIGYIDNRKKIGNMKKVELEKKKNDSSVSVTGLLEDGETETQLLTLSEWNDFKKFRGRN